jgi:hypothetical protein
MLDLETLSTRTDAAIVQIAALAFDPLTGKDPVGVGFNMFVRDLAGHVDLATVAWWLQQQAAPVLGRMIEKEGTSLVAALRGFTEWYASLGEVEAIWSHGATFDIPIMAHHCAVHGIAVPWSYRAPRDTRTLYALAPGGMPAVTGQGGAQKHDALCDCEIQIKQVVGAFSALRESQGGYR